MDVAYMFQVHTLIQKKKLDIEVVKFRIYKRRKAKKKLPENIFVLLHIYFLDSSIPK